MVLLELLKQLRFGYCSINLIKNANNNQQSVSFLNSLPATKPNSRKNTVNFSITMDKNRGKLNISSTNKREISFMKNQSIIESRGSIDSVQ